MYVSVCICMYIYVHVCTSMYVCVFAVMHACMYVFRHAGPLSLFRSMHSSIVILVPPTMIVSGVELVAVFFGSVIAIVLI